VTNITTDQFGDSDDILTEALEAEPTAETLTGWQTFWGRLIASRDVAILVVAIVLFLFFTLANQRFVSENNLVGIARRMPTIGIVAVGMTLLMIAGEIDLSVGTSFGLLMTIIAIMVDKWTIDPWLAMGVVIVLGLFIGSINGLLVTKVRLPAFIATLGMLAALRGVANALSGGLSYDMFESDNPFFEIMGGGLGETRIPNLFLIMLAVMLVGGLILAKTRFGSNVYATGGNVEAARNNGINTDRVKLICFIAMGGLCGLAGALNYGRVMSAPVSAGAGLELQAIAAIIIGGTGLFGGRGTMFGSLVGTFFLSMLPAGLILIGVPDFWDGIALGLVILLAATLDLIVRRAASRVLGRQGL
jgi:ribose/xylose/arabinose/galactoside ABC-type transport system permease subunit